MILFNLFDFVDKSTLPRIPNNTTVLQLASDYRSFYIGKCFANALNNNLKSFRDITTNMIFKIQITIQCDSEIFDSGDPA